MSPRFPRPPWLLTCSLASLTGVLLFLSDHPVHAWWIQGVALVPWLLGLSRWCPNKIAAAVAGLCLGLCYAMPLLIALEFPLLLGGAQALYITLLWVALSLGAFLIRKWPVVLGALATGAVAVLVEWIDFTLVPVWGTAQCFARIWSALPWVIQFVSLTGMLGLVFILVASQALLARAFLLVGRRLVPVIALILVVGLPAAFNTLAWIQKPEGTLRVAAIGWSYPVMDNPGAKDPQELLEQRITPMVERAALDGTKLLVSPEVGLVLAPDQKQVLIPALSALASGHAIALAIGYFDKERDDNRLLWIDSDGRVLGEYRKTHLIPFVERYSAGDGTLFVTTLDGTRAGGMICQDDNFTDLSRAYGRQQVQLVAVPTNDWEQVMPYHLENSIFRAVESRYAIVRAATNGTSAIVTARGDVMTELNPFSEGAGMIEARLPLFSGGSLYSFVGDWPVLGASLALLLLGFICSRRKTLPGPGRPSP